MELLIVKQAVKQVRGDALQIRRALGEEWEERKKNAFEGREPLLDGRTTLQIFSEFRRMGGNRRSYADYEIGSHFNMRHIILQLERRINLTSHEAYLLKNAFGRVFYNPPESEMQRQIIFCRRLAELGERGAEIFNAFMEEVEVLFEVLCKAGRIRFKTGDVFLQSLHEKILLRKYLEVSDFQKYAQFLGELIEGKSCAEPYYE